MPASLWGIKDTPDPSRKYAVRLRCIEMHLHPQAHQPRMKKDVNLSTHPRKLRFLRVPQGQLKLIL